MRVLKANPWTVIGSWERVAQSLETDQTVTFEYVQEPIVESVELDKDLIVLEFLYSIYALNSFTFVKPNGDTQKLT